MERAELLTFPRCDRDARDGHDSWLGIHAESPSSRYTDTMSVYLVTDIVSTRLEIFLSEEARKTKRERRRPEESEREILDAAEQLLRERPLSEITVGELMARTRLGRSSFYFYFGDLYDLVARLLTRLEASSRRGHKARDRGRSLGMGCTWSCSARHRRSLTPRPRGCVPLEGWRN